MRWCVVGVGSMIGVVTVEVADSTWVVHPLLPSERLRRLRSGRASHQSTWVFRAVQDRKRMRRSALPKTVVSLQSWYRARDAAEDWVSRCSVMGQSHQGRTVQQWCSSHSRKMDWTGMTGSTSRAPNHKTNVRWHAKMTYC